MKNSDVIQSVITYIYFRILSICNTHKWGEETRFLKNLTVVYIQKGLILEYIVQTLNLFNLYSFFNMGLTHFFFFLEY